MHSEQATTYTAQASTQKRNPIKDVQAPILGLFKKFPLA